MCNNFPLMDTTLLFVWELILFLRHLGIEISQFLTLGRQCHWESAYEQVLACQRLRHPQNQF